MAGILTYRSYRLLAIMILSLIGFFTARMPWLEYPRINLVFEGRHGVGWFTSSLFFLILVLTALMLFRKKGDRVLSIIIGIISGLLATIGIEKIAKFYLVELNRAAEFPLFNIASAGMFLRYGVYVLTVCGILIFFLILPLIFKSAFETDKPMAYVFKYGSIVLAVVGVLAGAWWYLSPSNTTDLEEVTKNLTEDYQQMNSALSAGRLDVVVDYTHPIIYQSMGGKQELKNVLNEVRQQLGIIDSDVSEVVGFEQKGRKIQALFQHNTTIRSANGTDVTRGSSFGFSSDGGQSWVFAGINGRTFREMKENFPEIFDELDYSVKSQE